jgi:hypothetical protein
VDPRSLRAAVALVAAAASISSAGAAAATRPLVTGVTQAGLTGKNAAIGMKRIAGVGGQEVRVTIDWSVVAQRQPAARSDQSDPANPAYDWASVDQELEQIEAGGLTPIVAIFRAPSWARSIAPSDPASPPKIEAWRSFVEAAARRYSGTFHGLPRVQYWEAWIEPNLNPNLAPQLVNGVPYAARVYRSMVNAMYASLVAVDGDNRLLIGGLGPFRDSTASVVAQEPDWGPLAFMRSLFCLSGTLVPICHQPVRADIWDIHPYTSGGPDHHAYLPNDVSLGDLGEMTTLLNTARAAGNLVAPHGLGLWVTEFSWDSSPPDPQGVPVSLMQRWVPEALYTMWSAGITHVLWLQLRDDPFPSSPFQSGLYFRGATPAGDWPKPFLQGFRFPFVALPSDGTVQVWGRTPDSGAASVVIEVNRGTGWQPVATVQAGSNGIFDARLPGAGRTGSMRARVDGSISLAFGLQPVPDHFYNPFGSVPALEPR